MLPTTKTRSSLPDSPHYIPQKIKAENPDMKITEISKVLGEKWREMDDDAKAPFQKKADADKERCVTVLRVILVFSASDSRCCRRLLRHSLYMMEN